MKIDLPLNCKMATKKIVSMLVFVGLSMARSDFIYDMSQPKRSHERGMQNPKNIQSSRIPQKNIQSHRIPQNAREIPIQRQYRANPSHSFDQNELPRYTDFSHMRQGQPLIAGLEPEEATRQQRARRQSPPMHNLRMGPDMHNLRTGPDMHNLRTGPDMHNLRMRPEGQRPTTSLEDLRQRSIESQISSGQRIRDRQEEAERQHIARIRKEAPQPARAKARPVKQNSYEVLPRKPVAEKKSKNPMAEKRSRSAPRLNEGLYDVPKAPSLESQRAASLDKLPPITNKEMMRIQEINPRTEMVEDFEDSRMLRNETVEQALARRRAEFAVIRKRQEMERQQEAARRKMERRTAEPPTRSELKREGEMRKQHKKENEERRQKLKELNKEKIFIGKNFRQRSRDDPREFPGPHLPSDLNRPENRSKLPISA